MHVSRFENAADDFDGPAAADDDENHARYHGGHLYDFADFERSGSVYSDQQRGRNRAAVVPEPDASRSRTCKACAREEILERNLKEANAAGNIQTSDDSRTDSRG